ncbi:MULTISPECIES: hypothetical protein [unclassified Microcoleus]|uniref:hypothetical protein n=1 Tax=unclassified Microcoleus TaxID=2642155 RepID=UPI0025CC96BC|nr:MULTISPECIES: hypothetical protein [unclassified Microcoleus]
MKITSSHVVYVSSLTTCCSSPDTVTLFEGFNETSITLKFGTESVEALSSLINHLNLTLTHLTTAKIEELERLQKLHCTCQDSCHIEPLGF